MGDRLGILGAVNYLLLTFCSRGEHQRNGGGEQAKFVHWTKHKVLGSNPVRGNT